MRYSQEKIDIIIQENEAGLFKAINSPNDILKFYFTKPIDPFSNEMNLNFTNLPKLLMSFDPDESVL